MTNPRLATAEPPVGGRLAIVGPSFFSYVEGIASEFRARGIEADSFDERHSNKVRHKILYRLGLYRGRLSPKLRHLANLLRRIEQGGFTDVLLLNVEATDRDFVSKLISRGVRVHLYMWDSLANKPGFKSFLDLLSSKSSFDPRDCETLGLTYIPLFATAEFDQTRLPEGDYEFDIGFCGTVHSSRTRILTEMLGASWARGRRFGLMLYYHSKSLFYVKALFDQAAWPLRRLITDRPYSKDEIARMFGKSRYVLDAAHPGQSGLTARTFEVLLSGSRLLTFNPLAAKVLPSSLAARIRLIGNIGEAAEIDFDSIERLPPLSTEERYFLSVSRFVDQLVDLMWDASARRPA